MTIFSAYDIIHAWCQQNKPLNWSFIYVCGNDFVKYVIGGKIYMILSVEDREKNYFKAKKFWTPFFDFKLCANLSGSFVCYRKS